MHCSRLLVTWSQRKRRTASPRHQNAYAAGRGIEIVVCVRRPALMPSGGRDTHAKTAAELGGSWPSDWTCI